METMLNTFHVCRPHYRFLAPPKVLLGVPKWFGWRRGRRWVGYQVITSQSTRTTLQGGGYFLETMMNTFHIYRPHYMFLATPKVFLSGLGGGGVAVGWGIKS